MHVIDRYAYANRIRRVDPAQKCTLALLTIALCLVLNHPAVGVVAIAWMLALAVGWAGLPVRAFARVLGAEGLFLGLSVAGIALSVGSGPTPDLLWRWRFGGFWIGSSPAALANTVRLVSRALGCASALNFLIMTTPLVDLIELFRRWRMPELLIDLMMLIYSSIFVLLESLQRMYTAQDARLGYRTPRRSMASAALLGSRLFIDAYQRSQRMQTALESRAYDGRLQVLPLTYERDNRTILFAVGITVSLLLAWVIL